MMNAFQDRLEIGELIDQAIVLVDFRDCGGRYAADGRYESPIAGGDGGR